MNDKKMEKFIFYHVWKGDTLDVSHWFNTNVQLQIITDDPSNEIVCKQAPHIHWVAPAEFEKQRKLQEKIYIELPTLYHVPVVVRMPDDVPKGYGVMIAVFDFDWFYFTMSNETTQNIGHIIRLSPSDIYIENKMSDKKKWIEKYVIPTWEFLYQNRSDMNQFQKRILVGLSKIIGEWKVAGEVSPQCDWARAIVDYDNSETLYHISMSLPFNERRQLFIDALQKGDKDWIETWWELLDTSFVLCKAFQGSADDWYKDIPVYRLVSKKLTNKTELYEKETMVLKKMPVSYDAIRRKYLFSKILTLHDPSSHHLFTHECTYYLKRLTAIEGCEVGDLQVSSQYPDYVPSSSGLIVYPENPRWLLINVRRVNYRILPNGTYITIKDGQVNPIYNGISKNEYYFMDRETLKPVSPTRPMGEDEIHGKREEELAIVGLEDVRLIPGINQDIEFYCVTKSYSYSDAIRIMIGKYDIERSRFYDTQVIHPPYEENACEKNWTWCGHNRYIYKWHPIEIGSVDANHRLVIDEHIQSPPYFKQFRGSSPAVKWKDLHFFSVHSYTNGKNGRKYIHSIVVLDLSSPKHQVIGVTSPFCFEDVQIEYNIGFDIHKGMILFLYSTRDSTSRYIRLPLYHILDNMYFPNKDAETLFKTRIYQDLF